MRNPDAPLEYRLLEALEGGHAAGGQATNGRYRPERSAWIRVVGQLDRPEIDLRVDLHDETLAELRRVFEAFKRYEAYYQGLADDPSVAVPEEEFVAGLKAA
ncbi:MAG: DUF1028 domain-containing protein [Burkholderiales bacterium]|nr:DUF1028 domain-containing protein [Burkholderiales bacterium]